MYDSVADAEMRLGMSIVTVAGKPVLIENVGEGPAGVFILYGRELYGDRREINVSLQSPHLCVASAHLGYIQCGSTAYYVCRSPNRRQKQGIDANQVMYYENGTREARKGLPYEEVAKAIIGPSRHNLKLAKDYILQGKDRGCSYALSPDLAISYGKLYYHTHEIGTVYCEGPFFMIFIAQKSFYSYDFKGVFDEDFRIVKR